jgi:predicted dinucleotide-binding enzyme
MAGAKNMEGKILVDVSNPLSFSKDNSSSLFACNTDSLGEQLQHRFPETKVVKALNTVTASIMVNPTILPAEHDLFMCGNDVSAKEKVTDLFINELGWKSIIDLGS